MSAQLKQVVVEVQELQLVIGQLVVVLAAQDTVVTLVELLVVLTIEYPEEHPVQVKFPAASTVPVAQF